MGELTALATADLSAPATAGSEVGPGAGFGWSQEDLSDLLDEADKHR